MKLFSCPNCGQRLYFENAKCLTCGSAVVWDPRTAQFTLVGVENVYQCLNATECDCNWATEAEGTFCCACVLNKTIPDLAIDGNRSRWARVERAKRRAVYSLLAFALPFGPKADPADEIGLAFDFLADAPGAGPGGEHVLTGHDNGLVTLNVAEADSAEREKLRVEMGERYRTLLGHFRHELGHYYWERLVRDDPARLEEFRRLFGDETADYASALQAHYANGAPAGWQDSHISAYAASHPWEDWAESWAHFMHITDTLEMVGALNMRLGELETQASDTLPDSDPGQPAAEPGEAAGTADPFARTLERWLVLSEASNSINRCMGLPDLYPFVISPPVAGKLTFIHRLLMNQRPQAGSVAAA